MKHMAVKKWIKDTVLNPYFIIYFMFHLYSIREQRIPREKQEKKRKSHHMSTKTNPTCIKTEALDMLDCWQISIGIIAWIYYLCLKKISNFRYVIDDVLLILLSVGMLNDSVDVNIFNADESNTELKMDPILTPTKNPLMPQHFTSEEGTIWEAWFDCGWRHVREITFLNVFV